MHFYDKKMTVIGESESVKVLSRMHQALNHYCEPLYWSLRAHYKISEKTGCNFIWNILYMSMELESFKFHFCQRIYGVQG